jgi:anti-sigma factor RsiW
MKETAMECTAFDWKGYALGELSAAETAECDRHALTCERCRTELARYKATVTNLRRMLPQVEPPRRIVFAPEPAAREVSWWRRMWQPSPQWGFASAGVLALAIVAHGLLARVPATPAPAQAAQIEARIHREAQKEVNRLLPGALDATLKTTMQTRLQEQLRPALASFQHQLSQEEQLHLAGLEQRRDADQKALRYAFERLDRKINYAMLSASRPQGGQ